MRSFDQILFILWLLFICKNDRLRFSTCSFHVGFLWQNHQNWEQNNSTQYTLFQLYIYSLCHSSQRQTNWRPAPNTPKNRRSAPNTFRRSLINARAKTVTPANQAATTVPVHQPQLPRQLPDQIIWMIPQQQQVLLLLPSQSMTRNIKSRTNTTAKKADLLLCTNPRHIRPLLQRRIGKNWNMTSRRWKNRTSIKTNRLHRTVDHRPKTNIPKKNTSHSNRRRIVIRSRWRKRSEFFSA